MTHFTLNKLMEIPEQLEHHFFSEPALSLEQVIEKLTTEINMLHDWLINYGDHYGAGTTTFFEKSQLLIDKISEREEIEKILEMTTKESVN